MTSWTILFEIIELLWVGFVSKVISPRELHCYFVRILQPDPGSHFGGGARHCAAVALGVFNELVEGVVAEGHLIDDGAGADGGAGVAADFAELGTICVLQTDAAHGVVDAGAEFL